MSATQLHAATEPGAPLRIVFVPSHHYGQVGPGSDFAKRVDKMWGLFKNHVFFRRYLSRISAWRIDAIRQNDMNPNSPDLFGNDAVILKWVQSEVSGFDPKKGDVFVFCVGLRENGNVRSDQNPPQVTMAFGGEASIVHELGHAIGNLGDEYGGNWVNQAHPEHANVAENAPGYTCQEKWGDMMGLVVHAHPALPQIANNYPTKIGCFANAHALNWYKPTDHHCLMNQCGSEWPFCPVCQRRLEKVMHRYGTGETTVTFESLPDGFEIKQPLLLKGNEFLAYGVKFSPAPHHYAASLKTQPAILTGGFGAPQNYLGMVQENNHQQPVSRNISIAFDWPLKEVKITFYGATSRYHLQAYDAAGNLLATAYQNAFLHQGPFQITVRDSQNNIRKVEFGEDQSITVITKIQYR